MKVLLFSFICTMIVVLEAAPFEIWYTPSPDSVDMTALFTNPQLWAATRPKVNVFKFYEQQLLPNCTVCANNTLEVS